MTAFGLVRPAVGDDKSARSKYYGPTGKRSAGKLACSVWSGGKAVRPYLSLLRRCGAARSRQLNANPFGRQHQAFSQFQISTRLYHPLQLQHRVSLR